MQNLHEKTLEELKRDLNEKFEELFKFRFQANLGKLDNTIIIRNTRRNIARLKTVINAKEKKQREIKQV
jgi:large subunit ribosomal protein L29